MAKCYGAVEHVSVALLLLWLLFHLWLEVGRTNSCLFMTLYQPHRLFLIMWGIVKWGNNKTTGNEGEERIAGLHNVRGTRWRSWFRHCATSRKVAGLISYGVIFHWLNSPGVTRDLGSTQLLTVWRIFPGGKGSRCLGLTALPPSRADCLEIRRTLTSWTPMGLSRPVQGHLYLYHVTLRTTGRVVRTDRDGEYYAVWYRTAA